MTRRPVTLAGMAALAFAAPASAAPRPADAWESLAVRHAAAHLTSIGVPVPADVPVVVDDCAGGYACVGPTSAGTWAVVLTPRAAVDATRYAYVATRPTAAGRLRAMRRCPDGLCYYAMATAVHELVHWQRLAPWRAGLVANANAWDRAREEGIAEAVAVDQVCPMERRSLGFTWRRSWAPECSFTSSGYGLEVDALRDEAARATNSPTTSAAARRWRLGLINERIPAA